MTSECCKRMTAELSSVCEWHPNRFACPDALLHRLNSGEIGIVIHDGGESVQVIMFCPFCGTRLREDL